MNQYYTIDSIQAVQVTFDAMCSDIGNDLFFK